MFKLLLGPIISLTIMSPSNFMVNFQDIREDFEVKKLIKFFDMSMVRDLINDTHTLKKQIAARNAKLEKMMDELDI